MNKIPPGVKDLKAARESMIITMLLAEPMAPENVEKAPDVVWHYTDSGGVRGIIGDRELWATDALFMNDVSELQLIHGLVSEMLLRFTFTTERLPDPDERKVIFRAFDDAFSGFHDDPGVYAVCFCEEGDLLSQWNAYGRGGGGYSLGFSSKALAALDPAVVGRLDFFQVIYDYYEQRIAVHRFIEQALNIVELWTEHHPDEPRGEILNVAGDALATTAQWFAARIKDSAFAQEREWRLVYRREAKKRRPSPYQREFRPVERGLVPYVKLPLAELHQEAGGDGLPLEQVVIGPTAREGLALRAMNYLLADNGHQISAETSKIPLRD